MKTFLIHDDANGASSFAIPFCDYVDVRVLLPNAAETVTVPTGAKFVVFSSAEDFFCRSNGTASIPLADIVDGTGSELNPLARAVDGVTSFSVIAPYNCTLTMSYYA